MPIGGYRECEVAAMQRSLVSIGINKRKIVERDEASQPRGTVKTLKGLETVKETEER